VRHGGHFQKQVGKKKKEKEQKIEISQIEIANRKTIWLREKTTAREIKQITPTGKTKKTCKRQ
jgi:hypothetical protein